MATFEQTRQLADRIQTKLNQFLLIRIDELIRESELGNQLSFKKGESIFVRILELFKRVISVDMLNVPFSTLAAFEQQLDHAINLFNQIRDFYPNTNNPVSQRDSFVSQLEEQFDAYVTYSMPILTIGLLYGNDLSVEKTKVNETLKDLESDREKTKQDSLKYLEEIKDVLDKTRQAALEVGISQHNMIFKEEAEEHKRLSENWLKWTIGVLVAITVVGVALLFIPFKGEDTHYLIHFTVTKIVVLTVMFYALAICMRNFKAHKHNSILNRHRQNALNTFETFSKAAGTDLQTKSAVLLEATHTIFSNQQTGYLSTDNETDSSNRVIEIIKSTTAKGQE